MEISKSSTLAIRVMPFWVFLALWSLYPTDSPEMVFDDLAGILHAFGLCSDSYLTRAINCLFLLVLDVFDIFLKDLSSLLWCFLLRAHGGFFL